MSESRFGALYWKAFYATARVFALLMAVTSGYGAIKLATARDLQLESGMQWGLVILLAVIAAVCARAITAPIRRVERVTERTSDP